LYQHQRSADAIHFGCQLPGSSPACYGPDQLRTAYEFQSYSNEGYTGAGRTVVIIDAFDNPYLASDLSLYSKLWKLAPASFTKILMPGTPPFDFTSAAQVNWSGESSLDVQSVHAFAPGAKIVYLGAASDSDADILAAQQYAINNNLGDVISMSFGEGESCVAPGIESAQHQAFVKAQAKRITLIASAGDDGAAQPGCNPGDPNFLSASSPAADPLVTAIGGTNLVANLKTGAYKSETAWSDAFSDGCLSPNLGCSGGGFSNIYDRPSYQANTPGTIAGHRGVPDLALNAGIDGGTLIHWGVGDVVLQGDVPNDPFSAWLFGGTSVGSPEFAGMIAAADQIAGYRLGSLNTTLYFLGNKNLITPYFHDITVGNNNQAGIPGYNAAPGWDPVTGFGSPRLSYLLPALIWGVG
jgi:subtilase family serine protease